MCLGVCYLISYFVSNSLFDFLFITFPFCFPLANFILFCLFDLAVYLIMFPNNYMVFKSLKFVMN